MDDTFLYQEANPKAMQTGMQFSTYKNGRQLFRFIHTSPAAAGAIIAL
jgi:hypothetical protein